MEKVKLLYIDLFCGAGGTSTGVEMATGSDGSRCAKVIACVNHDKNAIASHAANHPDALHFTEDIRTLELSSLVSHLNKCKIENPEALVVLWASLECTNFSKAKGGQPRDADSRTLAEHLFRYIESINPDYIQIENVEEFMSWGPMDENGKPISMRKGEDYVRWVSSVKSYGYNFDKKILNAADFGAYTSRKRFFGIFAKDNLPIVFPEPTHCKDQSSKLKKHKPVRDVLNLEDEGKSIFSRKKPLSEKTLERIYAGLIKFVAGGKEQWLLKYNSINGKTGKHIPPSIDDPCPTISCQNRIGIASARFLSKYYSGHPDSKNISIEGPAHTIKCKDNHALVCTKFLSAYYGTGDNVHSIDGPCPTITTKDRVSVVTHQFMDQQYGNGKPTTIDKPIGTITAVPKCNLVACKSWLMDTSFRNTGSSLQKPSPTIMANRKWHYLMNPQFSSPGSSIDAPCFTLIARMDKRPPSVVSVSTDTKQLPDFIKIDESGNVCIEVYQYDSEMTVKIKEFMAIYGVSDILMRMLFIPELKKIMGFPEQYVLVGTKAEQKKYIGNAVEVNIAKAICVAIHSKIMELSEAA